MRFIRRGGDLDPMTEDASLPRGSAARRIRPFVILLLSALVALTAGWALATVFQSSAQRDAATAPPASTPILATVTTGKLVRATAFSGSIVAENQESLSLAVPSDALRSVVTAHPVNKGMTVNTGQVLTEVNGRPVFVVQSAFPFYRDVGVGDQGPDVTSLQETLQSLGYSLDIDGSFGAQTEIAVRASTSDPAARPQDPKAGTDSGTSTAFVPYSEILGVKVLPSASLSALAVGSAVGAEGESDIVLGSTTTTVTFEAAPADLTYIAEGGEVSIEADSGVTKGVVSSIEPIAPSTQEDAEGGQPETDESPSTSLVTVIPSEPLQASNAKVRVVSSQVIVDEEALLVPTIAVVDRGDTNQVVIVRRPGGEFVEVEVTVLGALDGKAAIRPSSPSSIRDGDQVRVGSS